jgi:hypothetical protein
MTRHTSEVGHRGVRPGCAVYLKQWSSWYDPGDSIRADVHECPIPDRWHEGSREVAPIQSSFTHAGWLL